MKPNWLVVLVVGVIIGLSVTKLACNTSRDSASKPSSTQQAAANAQPTEASLAVKSTEFPRLRERVFGQLCRPRSQLPQFSSKAEAGGGAGQGG